VRDRTGVGTEIDIQSDSAWLLGLPWELMRDPERDTPLALMVESLNRMLPAAGLPDAAAVGGEGRADNVRPKWL